MGTPGRIGVAACGREPGRLRIDGAAHLIELANARGIELRDFETLAAAVGNQTLAIQQVQRVAERLARDPKLFRELVLPNAVARRQGAVGVCLENPRSDLIDQVRQRLQRDHVIYPWEYRIPNVEISERTGRRQGGGRR